MTIQEMETLLLKITVHYPAFKPTKQLADEWYRLIGYKEFQEMVDRLDEYLFLEDGNRYAPNIKWFKSEHEKKVETSEIFHAPISHIWHLKFMKWDTACRHGRLYDQEDREYVHDPLYEDGYHYDDNWNICTADGKIIFERQRTG